MEKIKDNSITVLIADDHPLLRKGLKDIIDDEAELCVIGEAGDGEQTLSLIRQLKPEIAIVDLNMPKISGLEVVRLIKEENINVKVIVLTMYDKENIFNKAIDLGINAYVIKDSALTEIVSAIKNVAAGKYFISPSISGFLVERKKLSKTSGSQLSEEEDLMIPKLTGTELKILRMIANKMTTKDIADTLFISINTVSTHRSNICEKLNLKGPNALLRFVLDHPNI